MADVTFNGVRRTDEMVVYVYGTTSQAGFPSGSFRTVGCLIEPPAQVLTPTNQIVVRYI